MSDTIRFPGSDVKVFFMALCVQCDHAMPFGTERERTEWALAHSGNSSHVVYGAVDVRPDPKVIVRDQKHEGTPYTIEDVENMLMANTMHGARAMLGMKLPSFTFGTQRPPTNREVPSYGYTEAFAKANPSFPRHHTTNREPGTVTITPNIPAPEGVEKGSGHPRKKRQSRHRRAKAEAREKDRSGRNPGIDNTGADTSIVMSGPDRLMAKGAGRITARGKNGTR